MTQIGIEQIAMHLALAARWTLLLSLIAMAGGTVGAVLMLLWRFSGARSGRIAATVLVEFVQGIPLLLLLFLVYFGLPLIGLDLAPLAAAALALTLYASAFLTEIWRGCIEAVPRGQWDAAAAVGLRHIALMRLVILPQAARIAVPPTVGFLVQLVKATALASIIGFVELTRSGQIVANATFRPLLVYGLVAVLYFAICFPLTLTAGWLERRMAARGGAGGRG